MPGDLPDPAAVAKPGTRLRALVAANMRRTPGCRGKILDVLEKGTVVTVLGYDPNGWYRITGQEWPSAWVGMKLLAPLQQR